MSTNALVAQNATMSIANVLMDGSIWDRAQQMGKALMKTSYLGNSSEFGATMAVLTMAKQNMDPVEFSRAYNMINDKPEMKPNYALGLFKMAGGRYKFLRMDEDECSMEFTAPDGTFAAISVKMEKMLKTSIPYDRDGNIKTNWANHPDDMLFARCTGKGLRRVWPEHMGGTHLAGEIESDDAAPKAPTKLTVAEVKDRVANATPAPDAPEVVVSPAPYAEPTEDELEQTRMEEDAAQEAVAVEPVVDDFHCPIAGPYLGVSFEEMEPDVLTFLLAPGIQESHPELTDAHLDNARKAMQKFEEVA